MDDPTHGSFFSVLTLCAHVVSRITILSFIVSGPRSPHLFVG